MGKPLVRVRTVEPLEGRCVRVTFTDGSVRTLDLAPFLHGPVFQEIAADDVRFREIRVEDGTVAWPNGADICPDVLYHGCVPVGMARSAKGRQTRSRSPAPRRSLHSPRTSSSSLR